MDILYLAEEESRERRELTKSIWIILRAFCQRSSKPSIILSYENLLFDQIQMREEGCYFRTNFLIGWTKERGLLVMEEYGPSEFLLSPFPEPELSRYSTLNRFLSVNSLHVLRKMLYLFNNVSVSTVINQ